MVNTADMIGVGMRQYQAIDLCDPLIAELFEQLLGDLGIDVAGIDKDHRLCRSDKSGIPLTDVKEMNTKLPLVNIAVFPATAARDEKRKKKAKDEEERQPSSLMHQERSRRPRRARLSVTSSVYSRLPPTGTP